MKKIIITITNILMSLALTCGSTTEYIKFNNVNDLMRVDTFLYSAPIIGTDESMTQTAYTIIKEKKAEKPEPVKEETTPTPEPVKKDDPTEKVEPVKKEETPAPTPEPVEPVKEEPQPEEPKDTVIDGNLINLNNNLNKRNGVESLPTYLQGYADQIIRVVLENDEMTHCFKWDELSSADMETIKQAINNTYFSYFEDRIIINCFDEGEYYLTVNNSRERRNKSLEIECNVGNIVNNVVFNGMTEKEAIKAINAYVCNIISYEEGQTSPYIAFQTGKGNCRVYACIFKMMCNQIGIECDYIEGYANGGYHAWNRVYISGVAYWIDCCWNNGGTNQYGLSVDLWSDHSVSTTNQFFYNDEF